MLKASGQLATVCLCVCVFMCWQQMSACKHVCLNLLSSLCTRPFRKAASVCVPIESVRVSKIRIKVVGVIAPCRVRLISMNIKAHLKCHVKR